MRISHILIALATLIGVKRAMTGRAPVLGELRYHVPTGQDAAAALATVRQSGFPAKVAMDGIYEDVVITCDPARDRERVRTILRDAPLDTAGKGTVSSPISFADEESS